jgi:DNA processing protein
LAKAIVAGHGAIISEYHPDAPALPGNFPSRNRIIAGLSEAILVTEAAKESGSLITAKIALEEGKTIYAVPGPITSSQSEGPLELIKDGATLVISARDILQDFGHLSSFKPSRSVEKLSTLEYQIISQLAREKTHLDELTRLLGQTSAKVSASLLKLEIEGFVYNEGNGVYAKNL